MKKFDELCVDQFGNYIIQSIIKLNNENINKEICFNLKNNIIFYCKHKYCSNIVEKIFDCNENINNEKNILIDIILEKENINNLIIDEHGNYVIQKLLSIIDENKRKKILEIIINLIPELKKKIFGEKVIMRLLVNYPELKEKIQM